jgi:hypothetical protein
MQSLVAWVGWCWIKRDGEELSVQSRMKLQLLENVSKVLTISIDDHHIVT